MQDIWQKIKIAFRSFMAGRHGIDQFSIALLYTGIALNLLARVPGLGALYLISLAMLAYSVFRMYSRDSAARYKENAWYLQKFGSLYTHAKQAFVRFRNRRLYVYFDCPECHAKLRLPRGKGEVTVTCGRCGHAFRKQV